MLVKLVPSVIIVSINHKCGNCAKQNINKAHLKICDISIKIYPIDYNSNFQSQRVKRNR